MLFFGIIIAPPIGLLLSSLESFCDVSNIWSIAYLQIVFLPISLILYKFLGFRGIWLYHNCKAAVFVSPSWVCASFVILMETDEIVMVLGQASDLHCKINDAIDRAMNPEIEINKGGAGPGVPEEEGEFVDKDEFCEVGEGAVEARSLSSIRDALEVLEDQLDCLRVLQQQQQAEREAALADLEESRKILLVRLRGHRGKEWEVVQEALAFAGEPVNEVADLPLPPYPTPSSRDASFNKEPAKCNEDPNHFRKNGAVKLLTWTGNNDEELVSETDSQICEAAVHGEHMRKDPTESKGIFGAVGHKIWSFGKPEAHGVALAVKTAFIAAGAATILALCYAGQSKQSKGSIHKVPSAPSGRPSSSSPTDRDFHHTEDEC